MVSRCGAQFCYRCGAKWNKQCTQGCALWDEQMLLAEENRVRQQNAVPRYPCGSTTCSFCTMKGGPGGHFAVGSFSSLVTLELKLASWPAPVASLIYSAADCTHQNKHTSQVVTKWIFCRPIAPAAPLPAAPLPAVPRGGNRFFRTKMCRDWVLQGWCPRDQRCQFAHGWEELRPHPDEAAPEQPAVPHVQHDHYYDDTSDSDD